MGAQNSNLRQCIEDEFTRLSKGNKEYLVLDQLMQLKLPTSTWMVDPSHLGVIFMLDSDRDGKITLDELYAFVDLARHRSRKYQPHDFQSQMQGYCTLHLWKLISSPEGNEAFIDWLSKLLVESMETRQFIQYPNHTYINSDVVETLHHLLNIQETQGMDFQSFFDMLQRVGEECNIMELDNEELDDWLPLAVLQDFLRGMNAGMRKVMEDIYPASEFGGQA